jgi:hypothetical protein
MQQTHRVCDAHRARRTYDRPRRPGRSRTQARDRSAAGGCTGRESSDRIPGSATPRGRYQAPDENDMRALRPRTCRFAICLSRPVLCVLAAANLDECEPAAASLAETRESSRRGCPEPGRWTGVETRRAGARVAPTGLRPAGVPQPGAADRGGAHRCAESQGAGDDKLIEISFQRGGRGWPTTRTRTFHPPSSPRALRATIRYKLACSCAARVYGSSRSQYRR